eukprot:gnl/TRDRNA2_/TRDRNA2_58560_c0_seq1.p1 gnl/TRDRNA2_/TRDRNA2_58560_c0~~gnl/TRDRNA2_/TRDRNA2_58560_c0_seq1.p1  ORF type:complete len:308 (+),score=14.66 gnl/TRDRNA2_/TRDRNA2_58560_c0_seq1:107-1030(+)
MSALGLGDPLLLRCRAPAVHCRCWTTRQRSADGDGTALMMLAVLVSLGFSCRVLQALSQQHLMIHEAVLSMSATWSVAMRRTGRTRPPPKNPENPPDDEGELSTVRETGEVYSHFEHKGFGFIKPDDGLSSDLVFYTSDVRTLGKDLVIGDVVSFLRKAKTRPRKDKALDVRFAEGDGFYLKDGKPVGLETVKSSIINRRDHNPWVHPSSVVSSTTRQELDFDRRHGVVGDPDRDERRRDLDDRRGYEGRARSFGRTGRVYDGQRYRSARGDRSSRRYRSSDSHLRPRSDRSGSRIDDCYGRQRSRN